MTHPLLTVEGLTVTFPGSAVPAVAGLGFSVAAGERLAIVGESGSGKSATAMALLGLLPPRTSVRAERFSFAGKDFDPGRPASLEALRGRRIGMVFQEPMTSLNPVLTIGRQLTEALVAAGISREESHARAIAMLARVGISEAEKRMRQYPHEFSGGMRQRVMIAMAMLLEPQLLIADEPTTALDVTVQAQVLDLMARMTAEAGAGLLLITHDMGVVAESADRVLVIRHGRQVESQEVGPLFAHPRDAYTRHLLASVPGGNGVGMQPPARAAQPILLLDGVTKRFGRAAKPAVDQVTLDLFEGETLALVGESGSGKSTLGRIAARLNTPDEGSVQFGGADITHVAGARLRRLRAGMQMVFQDPYASLDPRRTIGQSIAEPLVVLGQDRATTSRAVAGLLDRVGLSSEWAERLPHQLSGGQRQRVVIARALAADPRVLVADEPTSALDVSVQAEILKLLTDLQKERNLAILFITHDLAVVRAVAHRVAVMRNGRILESGGMAGVMERPLHPYTQALLSAAPVPDPSQRDRPRIPVPPAGEAMPLRQVDAQHWVAQ